MCLPTATSRRLSPPLLLFCGCVAAVAAAVLRRSLPAAAASTALTPPLKRCQLCGTTAGEAVESLSLVYSGKCQVTVDNRFLGEVNGGQYIGEMAYFTGEPASATVVAQNNVCVIQWPIETVRRLAHSHGHTSCAQAFAMLPSQFCRDLAGKLAVFNKTLDNTLNEEEAE